MADGQTPVELLQTLRTALIARRRKLAFQAAESRQRDVERDPSAGANAGAELKIVQEQIEAVDRAIEDEDKLAPSDTQIRSI